MALKLLQRSYIGNFPSIDGEFNKISSLVHSDVNKIRKGRGSGIELDGNLSNNGGIL